MLQDAGFKRNGNLGEKRGVEPEGFEWEANGIGRIVFTPHVTEIDFTVEGYNFKALLTEEVSAVMFFDVTPFCHICAILALSDQV